jgi:hypothetical protein
MLGTLHEDMNVHDEILLKYYRNQNILRYAYKYKHNNYTSYN